MRKAQKTQIEQTTSLLEQAQKEIKRALERKKSDMVLELTVQCQEAAIAIGNMIEPEKGADAIVRRLGGGVG